MGGLKMRAVKKKLLLASRDSALVGGRKTCFIVFLSATYAL